MAISDLQTALSTALTTQQKQIAALKIQIGTTLDAILATDASAAALINAAVAAPATIPVPSPAPTSPEIVLSADWATYNLSDLKAPSSPYWLMNSVWNKGILVNGKDFTQSMGYHPDTFPNNTRISWKWPSTPAGFNVYSYPALFHGTYQGWAPSSNLVTPKQVNAIGTLRYTHDVAISGTVAEFDVTYDGYLTKNPGVETPGLFEIMVYIHTPYYVRDWVNAAPAAQKSTFTDSAGVSWIMFDNPSGSPHMIMFCPSNFADLLTATVDMRAMLLFAKSKGLIQGTEYFNGFALGCEPRSLDGSVTIKSFNASYS